MIRQQGVNVASMANDVRPNVEIVIKRVWDLVFFFFLIGNVDFILVLKNL